MDEILSNGNNVMYVAVGEMTARLQEKARRAYELFRAWDTNEDATISAGGV